MIQSKEDYFRYLQQDQAALRIKKSRPSRFGDAVWKFERLLRKTEYLNNCKVLCGKLRFRLARHRLDRLAVRLGFSIPLNRIGPGLSIAHYGTIVINSNAQIGENLRIHEGVTIGATNGTSKAPKIGNNVFLGSGAKIIGDVTIADGVAVGANAVVVKDILEPNITVGGIPAKKISDTGSQSNLSPLTRFKTEAPSEKE